MFTRFLQDNERPNHQNRNESINILYTNCILLFLFLKFSLISLKMDSVEDSLKLAQQYHDSSSPSSSNSDDYSSSVNSSKYSSYFRLYEYQIVEMQHEYELLLEDKVC